MTILSYLFYLGNECLIIKKENVLWGQCVQMKSPILSAKRTFDDTVWTLGEVTEQGKITKIITSAYGCGLDIDTIKEDKYHNRYGLWQLKKLPTQEKKPLFTTEPMTQKTIQEEGKPPLDKGHICFERGHTMYEVFTFHNYQSSYGQHKCSRCGYEEDWQYDFPDSINPMYKQ